MLPPALPPNVYAWFLQVRLDDSELSHPEAIKLAYMLNSYGITPQMKPLPEPVPLTDEDINAVITKMAESPIQAGYAQSPWSPKDFQCTTCENIGHTAIVCIESPLLESGPRCFCCGQSGHMAIHCPAIDRFASPMRTPSVIARSQQSSSNTIKLDSTHSPWRIVTPSVGLTSVVPTLVDPSPLDPRVTSAGPLKMDPTL